MALIGKMDTATSRFAQLLAAQIRNEFTASQQYVAVAVWFDSQDLPRLAGHFYRQALEERDHAMMMVQYLLDADERAVIPGVAAPQVDFGDIVSPVALALGAGLAGLGQRRAHTVGVAPVLDQPRHRALVRARTRPALARGARPVVTGNFELSALERLGIRPIGVPLVSEHPAGKIRHHPDRLAAAILAIAQRKLGAWRTRVEAGGF